tara:strand:+ start:382 stop:801 length:420 start_codon:yes stop_codon:yes gene_type:complete
MSYISKNTNKIFDCVKNKKNMYIIGGIVVLCFILFLYMNKKPLNKTTGGTTSDVKFILYYVDWCPHCKVVIPEWDKLKKDSDFKNIHIEKINCEENKSAAEENNIEGFPTILFTKNDKVESYEGGREYGNFKTFLKTKM